MKVGVNHAKPSETGGKIASSYPNLDRAVTTKHKMTLACRDDLAQSVPHTGDIVDNSLDILHSRTCAIGRPPTHRKIAMINDLEPGQGQCIEKPGIP
jgi:hypothetical protein